jgi:hypothetical protein
LSFVSHDGEKDGEAHLSIEEGLSLKQIATNNAVPAKRFPGNGEFG